MPCLTFGIYASRNGGGKRQTVDFPLFPLELSVMLFSCSARVWTLNFSGKCWIYADCLTLDSTSGTHEHFWILKIKIKYTSNSQSHKLVHFFCQRYRSILFNIDLLMHIFLFQTHPLIQYLNPPFHLTWFIDTQYTFRTTKYANISDWLFKCNQCFFTISRLCWR